MNSFKRYIVLSISLVGIFTLGGCNKFLEEYSQDERVPKDVKEYSEILFGEAYFQDNSLPYAYLDLMTDDVKAAVNTRNTNGLDTREEAYGYFTWQENPELGQNKALHNDRSWESLYHQILAANVILKYMDTMTGTESDKEFLRGEAHAIRAFAYFMLANLYAAPYDPATAASTKGVPIHSVAHAEDLQFPRATLAEVYAQMVSDLEAGLEAFGRSHKPISVFRWNATALSILGSRIYLYMKDYDNAIKYADRAMSLSPTLYDLNKKLAGDPKKEKAFFNADNKEVAFSFGFRIPTYYASDNLAYFPPSDDLLDSYTKGDLRYYDGSGAFVTTTRVRIGGSWLRPIYAYYSKLNKSGDNSQSLLYGNAIRNAEALLNRAEAYAESGKLREAVADLHTLAAARYATGSAPKYPADDREAVIQAVRNERRKELMFEFHRWFDLRRWHQPALKHDFIVNVEDESTETYTLNAGDPRYTLPIPQAVRLSDPALTEQ